MATKEVIETDAIVGENTLEQDIMDALDDLGQSGMVPGLGCSNETTWGLSKSLMVSELDPASRHNFNPMVS